MLTIKETTKETKAQPKTSYEIAAQAAYDKKSWDISILNMEGSSMFADYFIICSARNNKQSPAIADAVEEALEANGYDVRHVEGYREGKWILVDAGEVITHIFVEQDRQYYDLENLWCDAQRIPFEGE